MVPEWQQAQWPPPPVGLGGAGQKSALAEGTHKELRNRTAANNAIVFFTVRNPFKVDYTVIMCCRNQPRQITEVMPVFLKMYLFMTLNSALEDLRTTTLKAISGMLRRLEYFAGLRTAEGTYNHWGLARVHGDLAAARAIEQEHRAVVSGILSTPIQGLLADVERCSELAGTTPALYVEKLIQEGNLLPPNPGAGATRHFNSVLHALSGLAKVPPGAIRLIS
jgi:hypothetical protein